MAGKEDRYWLFDNVMEFGQGWNGSGSQIAIDCSACVIVLGCSACVMVMALKQ